MRPVAYGLQLLFGFSAVAAFITHGWVGNGIVRNIRNPRKLLAGAGLIIVSTLLSLAVAEGALRLLDIPFKESWAPVEYARAKFDSELGWDYLPDTAAQVSFHAVKEKIPVYTDSMGIRVAGTEHKLDPSRPSVLFVGGSYTMGAGLLYKDTLPGNIERLQSFPFQAVNLGVEAYGTDQALIRLKRLFDKFDTRVVVYTSIMDHVNRNSNYDRRELIRNARFKGTKPLFSLRPDGTLYLKKAPVRYEDYSYSRLGAVMRMLWFDWGPRPDFALTRKLVQEMRDFVESRGATFIVVDWDWDRPSYGTEDSIFRGLPVNLIDTRENPPDGWINWWNNGWNIPDDSHPNARAHARVAGLIYEKMIESGLVK